MREPSALEALLLMQIQHEGLPEPVREWRFDARRRWRIDLAWPAYLIGCEVEGGVWSGGRHTRGAGFTADCLKYNSAVLLGWRLMRVTRDMIEDGTALDILRAALAALA